MAALNMLTLPPAPPGPTDGANFGTRAFEFLNWWYAVHGPELNTWVAAFNNSTRNLNSYVTDSGANATAATTKASEAATSASTATAKAAEAAASATAAANASNAFWLGAGVPPTTILPTFQWRPGREDMPSIVTATRASIATRVNEVGLIEQVANNVMREDFDPVTGECLGLLVEGQRTNYFLNSSTPATQSFTVTAQAYSLSFYGTGTITLSGTHSATVAGNSDGTRKSYTFTPTAGTLTATLSGTINYPQLEAGSYSSSYIPTSSTSVTRSADLLTVATSAFPFNSAEGTLYIHGRTLQPNNLSMSSFGASLHAGSASQFISALAFGWNSAYGGYGQVPTGVSMQSTGYSAGTFYKNAVGYKSGDYASVIGGGTASTSTVSGVPTITTLGIGSRVNTFINGHIKHIAYFPRRVSNSQLQLLTT